MASLRGLCRAVSALQTFSTVRQARRVHIGRPLAAYWNKDWAPSQFPETPKERAAAAKKYGLRVEDYKPYPNDGTGIGDYPELPIVSQEGRDPYANWDMPDMKRNFGEPVHAEANWLTEDRMSPDVVANSRYSLTKQFLIFCSIMGGVALLAYIASPIVLHPAIMPKQYPYNNLHIGKGEDTQPVVYYTFESAEE